MIRGHVDYRFKQAIEQVIAQYGTLNNREALADILAEKAIELARLGDWNVDNRYQG